MDDEIESLKAEIISKRRVGEVVFIIQDRRFNITNQEIDPVPILDKFLQRTGFLPLGKAWFEIQKSSATSHLENILHRDLAYNGKIMGKGMAEEFAQRFLSLFSQKARYFTNGNFGGHSHLGTWTPITSATFDTGVVCLDAERIGSLWILDED